MSKGFAREKIVQRCTTAREFRRCVRYRGLTGESTAEPYRCRILTWRCSRGSLFQDLGRVPSDLSNAAEYLQGLHGPTDTTLYSTRSLDAPAAGKCEYVALRAGGLCVRTGSA